jgi:hypothetical protein
MELPAKSVSSDFSCHCAYLPLLREFRLGIKFLLEFFNGKIKFRVKKCQQGK